MQDPRSWISGDESARDLLARVPTERPFLLPAPLHRVPLRTGSVVEIAGPSPSAKSEVLLQAAIDCILPKEWNGVHFGGLERMVMFFDLDCRFDVLRLAQALKHRIMEAHGSTQSSYSGSKEGSHKYNVSTTQISHIDDGLFLACMRRFLYIRCYSSLEFLAALKTMRYRAQMECEASGVGIHFLMIDSIGAFYWIDRACQPLSLGDNKRKFLSLQNVVESIVEEIRKFLKVQPLLVLATKAVIFGAGISKNDTQRAFGKRSAEDMSDLTTSDGDGDKLLFHEYMPSVWQSFITHRVQLRVSDGVIADNKHGTFPVYTSLWVQPSLNLLDKFTVRDNGIFILSEAFYEDCKCVSLSAVLQGTESTEASHYSSVPLF